jgi:hypothetical protein
MMESETTYDVVRSRSKRRDGFNAVVAESTVRRKKEQDSQLARGCHHRIRPISSIAQKLGFKLSLIMRSKISYSA